MINDEKDSCCAHDELSQDSSGACNNACDAQLLKVQTQLVYLRADFDNFRRNTEKERAELVARAQGRIFIELLPIVDNFERALKDLASGTLAPQELARFQGIELIYRELIALLKRSEVSEVPVEGLFDPLLHEALAQVDAPDKVTGSIVDVVQKGYRQRQTILRPAKVTVAR